MGVIKLFQHIGNKVKLANPWLNAFAVNCIQLPDNRIVNIIGSEKESITFDDTKGTGFYIRTNPRFTYAAAKQFSSDRKNYQVTAGFRLVLYAINQLEDFNPAALVNEIETNLRTMTFTDYFGSERKIEIILIASNMDAVTVFKEEVGALDDSGAKVVAICVDAQVKFLSSNDNCENDCGTLTSTDILQSFNFCDPAVFARLCYSQKECLKEQLAPDPGLTCEQLNECQVIIDIKEQLNTISGGANLKKAYIAGETLGGHRVVIIDGGKVFYFDPTNEDHIGRKVGITNGAVLADESIDIVLSGVITGFSGALVPDTIYYIGAAGVLTATVPTSGIDCRVGIAIDGDSLQIEFSEPVII